jgi:hypothetical protein
VLDAGVDAHEQGLISGDELRTSTRLNATIPQLGGDKDFLAASPVYFDASA